MTYMLYLTEDKKRKFYACITPVKGFEICILESFLRTRPLRGASVTWTGPVLQYAIHYPTFTIRRTKSVCVRGGG